MHPDENSLAHFGIKGMKWGRRKQRPHGNGRQGRMSARQKRARDMSNMSDTELQRYLNRRRMENEYHKMNRTGGEKFRSWAVGVGKQAAERAAKRAANQLIDRGLDAGAGALRAYGPSALEGAKSLGSRAAGALKRTPGKELVRYDPGVGGGIGPRRKSRGEQVRESLGGLGSKARSAASRAQGGLGGLGSKARSAASRAQGGLGGLGSKARSAASRAQGGLGGLGSKARSAASRAQGGLGGLGSKARSAASRAQGGLGGLGSKARSAASRAQGGLGGLGSKARSAMRRSKQSTPGKELVLHNPTARGQAAFERLKRKQRRANSGFKQGRPGTTMRPRRSSRQRG